MIIEYEINGQTFTALNGGPVFRFNEAVSFQVLCEFQEEIDYYWEKLFADCKLRPNCSIIHPRADVNRLGIGKEI